MEIKAAYFRLSKQYHPDITKSSKEEAAKKYQEIREAWEVLGDDRKRYALSLL